MLLHACPRCHKLIPHGQQYCETCAPLAEAERIAKKEHNQEYLRKKYNREYNLKRNPKYAAFYRSKDWRVTSKAKLSFSNYRCEAKLDGCAGIGCEVHHIHPIKTPDGWEQRLDWNNLMSVCIQCHNILDGKTFRKKEAPEVIDLQALEQRIRAEEADPGGGSKSITQ